MFDLPEPRLLVTEHQAMVYRCAHCRCRTTAAFPQDVASPAQYGARVRAAAVYLNVQLLIPEDRAAQTMADLFGAVSLCPDSIVAWGRKKADELWIVAERIAELAAEAAVRHLDETGFRVAGKLHWLHTASTTALTSYRVTIRRGDLPTGFRAGVIVHDHFAPYYALAGVRHALCNAHHLRELNALIEIDHEPWASQMRDFLLDARAAVQKASAEGAHALDPPLLRCLIRRYNAILRRGLAFHRNLPPLVRSKAPRRPPRRPGHNLVVRLRKFKDDTLRFLFDFAVPFTNNDAERDLRMMKVKIKISEVLPNPRGSARLRKPAVRHRHRKKAGLEYPPHRRSKPKPAAPSIAA